MINRSDPNIFNSSLTHGDHTLTAKKIASYIRDTHPELSATVTYGSCYYDVDEFVREEEESKRDDDLITFLLQAHYQELSKEARRDVYEIVMKNSDVVDGKYFARHVCAGIIVSLSS